MRNLLPRRDVIALGKGAAVAAVAGLLMGAAMQPELSSDGFRAPQLELPRSGARLHLASADAGLASYGASLPEHVIGTDYTRPHIVEQAVLAYDERVVEESAEDAAYDSPIIVYEAAAEAHDAIARDAVARREWSDEPASAPLYPSQQGNTYYGSDLPEPPSPPEAQPAAA